MDVVKHIPQAELARDPVGILQVVRRRQPIVVEDQGRPQATIVDPVDLQILLAVVRYYVDRPRIDSGTGLSDAQVTDLKGQPRFDLALAHYLAEAISLSRTAEVLETSWLELRERFSRLGLPLRTAPIDEEGVRQDILVAESSLP